MKTGGVKKGTAVAPVAPVNTSEYWNRPLFLEILLAMENINCVFPADTAKTNQNTPCNTKEIPLGCDKEYEWSSFTSPLANNNKMNWWHRFQQGD